MKLQDLLVFAAGLFALIGGGLMAYAYLLSGTINFGMAGQISVALSVVLYGLYHHATGEDDLYHAEMVCALGIAALTSPPLIPAGLLENLVIAVGVISLAISVIYIYLFFVFPELKKELGIK